MTPTWTARRESRSCAYCWHGSTLRMEGSVNKMRRTQGVARMLRTRCQPPRTLQTVLHARMINKTVVVTHVPVGGAGKPAISRGTARTYAEVAEAPVAAEADAVAAAVDKNQIQIHETIPRVERT